MGIFPDLERRLILYLAVLSVFVIFLGDAKDLYGQGGKTWMGRNLEQQVSAAGLKLGPFRIRTILQLPFAGYDSNVYRTTNNPIRDFSITVGPGFYIYLPIQKKIVISVYESPQYVYFAETKREQTWNNYFNGQVNLVLNRFFVTLGKGYSVAREIWTTEMDIRPQRKEDSSLGSILWQISKKTSAFFGFSQAKYDYEDLAFGDPSIKVRLNRTENLANFMGYYRISFHTMLFLNYEYANFKFQSALNPRDSMSHGVYGGLEFSPVGAARGRISIGYKYLDVLQAGVKDYQGIVGDTGISIIALRSLVIRANYRRDIEFSSQTNSAYYIENIIGGGASIYLSRNIRVDYDYYFGENSYAATILGPSFPQTRKDSYENHSAGIFFRVKNDIGLGMTGSLWDRNSNISYASGKQTMIGIKLIYNF